MNKNYRYSLFVLGDSNSRFNSFEFNIINVNKKDLKLFLNKKKKKIQFKYSLRKTQSANILIKIN